ncbi:MAG TPA: universal stress protein [Chloroflexia bacterium]|nr:universal stress protein [Chloroflexia bacterium]
MFKKLLVPLDGSMLSEKVLPYAVRLANRIDASILLLRIVDAPAYKPVSYEQQQSLIEAAGNYLAEVVKTLANPELQVSTPPQRVETKVVFGEPVKEICELALFEKADLIVMSTHGRSGLSRLLMGSVASQILHNTALPVMLLRPFTQKNDQLLVETLYGIGEQNVCCFDESNGRILLTLDGSEVGEVAIEPAVELARKLNATVYLLRVVHPFNPVTYGDMIGLGYDRNDAATNLKEAIDDGMMYLNEVEKLLNAKGVPCVKTVRSGVTAMEIIDYVQQIEPNAIVMATHGRGEVGHLFMGSVAEEVMRQSHLPVLMVPARQTVKEAEKEARKETERVQFVPTGREGFGASFRHTTEVKGHGFDPAFEISFHESLEKPTSSGTPLD